MSQYFAFFLPALINYLFFYFFSRQNGGIGFAYATAFFIFGVIPFLDFVWSRWFSSKHHARTGKRWSELLIVLLSLPLQLVNIFFFAWFISSHTLAFHETAFVILCGGILSALYAQNPAHELIHHGSKFERLVGVLLFSTSCYSGAKLAHVHSHHLLVATPSDPTSAKYNQSLYAYLPGAIAVNLFGWWGHQISKEKKNLGRSSKLVVENLLGYGLSALWAGLIMIFFGPFALVGFVIQSAIGILVLEMMNFIGHYGLERHLDVNGRLEAVSERHAWDCDFRFSNLVLISVQKHADHHINPHKSYEELRCIENSPRLPLSYPLLFLLTLFPFLWRAVIHPRLHAYQQVNMPSN